MRCFLALLPDAASLRDLTALQRECAGRLPQRGVRPVSRAALHVTLAFLGDQPEAVTAALIEAAPGLVDGQGPVVARGEQWLLLPSFARPRVLALSLASAGRIEALGAAARSLAAAAGARCDGHALLAHLSLWRCRHVRLRAPSQAPALPLRCDRIALLASHLASSGARYRPLWQARL